MKQNRRADDSAEEHSEDVNSSAASHLPNHDNEVAYPEPNANESNEMRLEVFIADDSIEIRNRLIEMLMENKSIHLMGESGDAEQAVIALRTLKPDVVILDIHMPKGEGMQVLQEIKMRDPGRLAIVFTAFPYPEYRRAYLAAGADYFFDKTQDFQKMADVLAKLAEKHFTGRNENEKRSDTS